MLPWNRFNWGIPVECVKFQWIATCYDDNNDAGINERNARHEIVWILYDQSSGTKRRERWNLMIENGWKIDWMISNNMLWSTHLLLNTHTQINQFLSTKEKYMSRSMQLHFSTPESNTKFIVFRLYFRFYIPQSHDFNVLFFSLSLNCCKKKNSAAINRNSNIGSSVEIFRTRYPGDGHDFCGEEIFHDSNKIKWKIVCSFSFLSDSVRLRKIGFASVHSAFEKQKENSKT